MQQIKEITLQKYKNQQFQDFTDSLAIEEPLEIRLNYGLLQNRQKMSLAVTMRTPGNDENLVAGFLLTEGIIQGREDLISTKKIATKHADSKGNIVLAELSPNAIFDPATLERHFYTTSSCGICGKTSIEAVQTNSCFDLPKKKFEISPETLLDLPKKLEKHQSVFTKTGGIHAAALFNKNGDLLLVREDIGRHNAVDKLIGAAMHKYPFPLSDYLILVSGRAGFELIQKSLMAGIPYLAAVGAPSSLAVSLAREAGMNLVGFLRNGSFNVYSSSIDVQINGIGC
ncbi:MAG: FdhD protein [Paraglaciecola sp.]|jgi:FdhD protein